MKTERKYCKSKKSIPAILTAVLISIFIGYGTRGDDTGLDNTEAKSIHRPVTTQSAEPEDKNHSVHLQSPEQAEKRVYVCPMNCVPPMEKPGKCPVCGMELVPADGHRHEEGPPRLSLMAEHIKAAGIQVPLVEKRDV